MKRKHSHIEGQQHDAEEEEKEEKEIETVRWKIDVLTELRNCVSQSLSSARSSGGSRCSPFSLEMAALLSRRGLTVAAAAAAGRFGDALRECDACLRDATAVARGYARESGSAQAALEVLAESAVRSHIRGGQLACSAAETGALAAAWGPEAVARAVGALARAGVLDFPWKRVSMGDPDALFRNVQAFELAAVRAEDPQNRRIPNLGSQTRYRYLALTYGGAGRFLRYASSLRDYDEADVVTDYFQEEARLSAVVRGSRESPLADWRSGAGAERAAARILLRSGASSSAPGGLPRPLDAHELREALWECGQECRGSTPQECTMFKATLARTVYDLFGARDVLDFSAGWGDRLVGALAARTVEAYLGVDPNTALRAGHEAIVARFAGAAGKDAARFGVLYEPFQTCALPAGRAFDLVFTSPPYFTKEIYTTAPGQSVGDFPDFPGWVTRFLFAALGKAWAALREGGHMAIHITDVKDAPCLCEMMALYVLARLPAAAYLGMIGSLGDRGIIRPIWVWRKLLPGERPIATSNSYPPATPEEAEAVAREKYPHIWKLI